MDNTLKQLAIWYQFSLGAHLHHAECHMIKQWLPSIPGNHVLQIGGTCELSFLESSPIHHKIMLSDSITDSCMAPQVCIHLDSLPLQSNSIDALVIAHAIEMASNPIDFLADVYRVMRPGGQAILLIFNRFSLWNIKKTLQGSKGFPWSLRFFSRWEMSSLLKKSQFNIKATNSCFYRPAWQQSNWLKNAKLMESIGPVLSPHAGASMGFLISKQAHTPLTLKNTAAIKLQKTAIRSGR